jgi:plastocyanin
VTGEAPTQAPTTANTTAAKAPTSASSETPGGTLTLEASPKGELMYVQRTLSAKAGKVTIEFINKSPLGHDVVVEQSGKALGETPGDHREHRQTHADPEGWHLQVLLLGPRPPSSGHGRNAHGLLTGHRGSSKCSWLAPRLVWSDCR